MSEYTKLTEFSPAADVLECLLNAHRYNTEDCIIYDEGNSRTITVGSVREVIKQLRGADV